MSARGLFEVFVLGRRERDRERLSGLVEVVVGPGDGVGEGLRAGDLLVRGAMGEGRALLSVFVTGELHDVAAAQRADLELEGVLPGRYAWVVEDGPRPREREARFARRVADGRGFVLHDQVLLRVTARAVVPVATQRLAEWAAEAVNRHSPEYVRWYQDALNRVDGAGLAVDGILGPLTRAAVRRYQARKGLAVDGIVGPNTERALMLDGVPAPPGFTGPPITPPAVTAVRVRRDITSLSPTELSALASAINELKRRRVYHEFVRDHANSMINAHRQSAFLPWHRQFILIYESELRAINSSITLPYWDWSIDPGVDAAGNASWNSAMVRLLGGNGSGTNSAVTTGPFAAWTAVDSAGNDTSLPLQRTSWALSLPRAADVGVALLKTPYDESPWDDGVATGGFRNELEGWARANHLHNVVHGWVGGSMLPDTSPNDPCFFLHHCFVDKIWADWQAAHPSLSYLPATREARSAGRAPAWGINDDVAVFHLTATSPVTYRAANTLDLNNLRDHMGATGIQVRYA
jgi:tyrosinase